MKEYQEFSSKIPFFELINLSEDGKYIIFPESVVCIALNKNGKYIFVRQKREVLNVITIEIPGGIVENNEGLLEASVREFEEETGFKVEKLEFVFTMDMDVAASIHKIHVFHGIVSKEKNVGEFDILELTLAEALDMVNRGIITHAPTVAAILWIKASNK